MVFVSCTFSTWRTFLSSKSVIIVVQFPGCLKKSEKDVAYNQGGTFHKLFYHAWWFSGPNAISPLPPRVIGIAETNDWDGGG